MAQQEPRRIAPGVYWIDQTPSTQDLATGTKRVRKHGDVIATDNQTAGRGRLDRTWDTPPGTAAAMSIVLRPKVDPQLMSTMTLVAADALVSWFRELHVPAAVKWPNDVLDADGRKLCGILAQWLPETQAVVIGIGTNLCFSDGSGHERAGALADYGVEISAQDFVIEARHRLMDAVERFIAKPDVKPLETTMSTIGQRVKAILPDGKNIIGTAMGLGPTGSLLIAGETLQEIFAADIVHLRPA